jgi:hypothetical protein
MRIDFQSALVFGNAGLLASDPFKFIAPLEGGWVQARRGEMDLLLTVEGKPANPVRIHIR